MRCKRVDHAALIAPFFEQRLRLLEVRRVETFGEPVVNGREQVTGFAALALFRQKRARLIDARNSARAGDVIGDLMVGLTLMRDALKETDADLVGASPRDGANIVNMSARRRFSWYRSASRL
jgi:hypothetical protein